jgi:DNA-binding response OmpR family regulator
MLSTPGDEALTLFLVEDEPSAMLAITEYFSTRGWRVLSARSLEEGSAIAARARFDLAILDLRLIDAQDAGLTLAREIVRLRPLARVILLGGYTPHVPSGQAASCGVDLVLAKPVRLSALRAAAIELVQRPRPDVSRNGRSGR